jgi:hypothetical protein
VADQTLRFDIVGDDHASGAFSRVGVSAGELSKKMDIAARTTAVLDEALKRQGRAAAVSADATLALARADKILAEEAKKPIPLTILTDDAKRKMLEVQVRAEEMKRKFPELTVQIDDREAKLKLAIIDAEAKVTADKINKQLSGGGGGWRRVASLIPGVGGGGGGGGVGSVGSAASAGGGLPLAGGPWGAAAIGAGVLAAAPLAGTTVVAGAGVAAFAALAIPSFIKVSTALTKLKADQAAYDNALTKTAKNTAAKRLAQDWAALDPAQRQAVKGIQGIGAEFGKLAKIMEPDVMKVFNAGLKVASGLLPSLLPLAQAAAAPIAGLLGDLAKFASSAGFKQFIASLAKEAGPAIAIVGKGLGQIAIAGGKLVLALGSPDAQKIARVTLTGIAKAVTGIADALAWLIPNVVKWSHATAVIFDDFRHRTAVVFDGARHDIAHVWDQIYQNSIGMVIRLAHNVETQWDSWTHGIAVVFDGARHDIAHVWDQIYSNSVGAVIRVWQKTNTPFANMRHDIAGHMDGIRHDISHAWDLVFSNSIGSVIRIGHNVETQFGSLRHSTSDIYDGMRHDISRAWDVIWSNTIGQVARGIGSVVNWFRPLAGRVSGAVGNVTRTLASHGADLIRGLLGGIVGALRNIGSWVNANIVQPVISAVKHFFGISSPSTVFAGIGGHLVGGLIKGLITSGKGLTSVIGKVFGSMPHALLQLLEKGIGGITSLPGKAISALKGLGSGAMGVLKDVGGLASGIFRGIFGGPAGGAGGGVQRWAPTVLQALKMEGLPSSLLGDVLYQMQTESGGNPMAQNNTDINAQLGTPSKGLMQVIAPTFDYWHWPGTSWNIFDPLANIAAAINYGAHGKGFGSGFGQIGSGHGYAFGTGSAAPGWAWVGERGPELVKFRGGEQVAPAYAGSGGGGNIYITVNAPVGSNPRDIGRQIADVLGAHIKAGGRIYPAGMTPR